MQNYAINMMGEKRGRSQLRLNKGKGDTGSHHRARMLLSCHGHNSSERPASHHPDLSPILLVGWVHVLSLSYYLSQAEASLPWLPPTVFKHCIPWRKAAESLGGKHQARSQHQARARKDPCPFPALQAVLFKS